MGQDVERTEFTRQDRQRYRAKVRRCLDVFARMLSESKFDFDRPMTGLEIEFNLIDGVQDPAMRNSDVLHAIENPGLPDRTRSVQHRDQRAAARAWPGIRWPNWKSSCAPT